MKKYTIPHDQFHDNEGQVKAHILPPEPPDITSIDSDESRGGVNPKPIVIMEGDKHRSAFKHEKEHDLDPNYGKGKK